MCNVQVQNNTSKPEVHVPPSIAPEEYFSKEKNKAKLKFRVRTDSVMYYAILVGCHSSYMYNVYVLWEQITAY